MTLDMSMMSLATWISVFVMSSSVVYGCFPMDTGSTSYPNFYDDEGGEVWQGSVDFIDYWCGIPETSYHVDSQDTKRRQLRDISEDIDINNYRLDHSIVLFRSKSFEFGPGVDLVYDRGGVGRNAEGCPVSWTRYGQSKCTVEEAEEMAALHQAQYGYHLLWNNCHHFAEWFLRKLVTNQCSLAPEYNKDDAIGKIMEEKGSVESFQVEEDIKEDESEVTDGNENKVD
ncbi:uncharacterized protein LOC121430465 [Lytechinus variegatus]|uniref:uncharacterized protein LOC121430465 n=1 Tax=Lytechinus variegatus TaxID=7654 RepID=UPI001BB2717E|nr:uncharacterized protein LOC121430465 [Lytechinus variegatus]